jgi:(1->4)-alpha-D-glucan 1-alpha-D-glucosylmutase
VPDLYQGSELWDLSLVDPDNRRPVDYDDRRRVLVRARDASAEQVLAMADEGAPKLWLTQRALAVRRAHPEAFGPDGGYHPLTAAGEQADHVVAFVRGDRVAVIVPRLVVGLAAAGGWGDTTVELPAGEWDDALAGTDASTTRVADVLGRFPVALLVRR